MYNTLISRNKMKDLMNEYLSENPVCHNPDKEKKQPDRRLSKLRFDGCITQLSLATVPLTIRFYLICCVGK